MRDILEAALRVLCGATAKSRLDGLVEITFCGATQTIDQARFAQKVVPVVRETNAAFMIPQGIAPPLDGEAIIKLASFLNTAFSKALSEDPRQRIKVAFYCALEGARGYWRCTEPARMLNELYPEVIYADVTPDLDFYRLLEFDVIVVQGGKAVDYSAEVQLLLERLVKAGKKLVYEMDDDLDSLTHANSYLLAMDPASWRLEQWLRKESAAIFTTTDILAEKLRYPDKTFVLPNSLDLSRFDPSPRVSGRDDLIFIMWHGGQTHEPDLAWIGRELYDLMVNKRPKLEKDTGKKILFGLMGYLPAALKPLFNESVYVKENRDSKKADVIPIGGTHGVRYLRAVPTRLFHETLIGLQPDLVICPLEPKIVFNQSKSSIKWAESTLAGAACIVTEPLRGESGPVPGPFSTVPDDCVSKTTTAAEMIQRVQELIKNEDKRRGLVEASTKHLREHYDLRKNARLWAEALAKITGCALEDAINVDRA